MANLAKSQSSSSEPTLPQAPKTDQYDADLCLSIGLNFELARNLVELVTKSGELFQQRLEKHATEVQKYESALEGVKERRENTPRLLRWIHPSPHPPPKAPKQSDYDYAPYSSLWREFGQSGLLGSGLEGSIRLGLKNLIDGGVITEVQGVGRYGSVTTEGYRFTKDGLEAFERAIEARKASKAREQP